MEQETGSTLLRKEYIKAVYCHPDYLIYMQSKYIMLNVGLKDSQVGIKIAGRSINKLSYTEDTTLMAESEDELKNLLMNVKAESEKAGLKPNIQKMKITASDPITSWHINWGKLETATDLISGAPKSLQMVIAAMKLKDACVLEEKL